ncbi:MAG: DUF1571 domain-containing protein [Planctomycetota bacterium]
MQFQRRNFLAAAGSLAAGSAASRVWAEDRKGLVEPVHRVATAKSGKVEPVRPLDRALQIARDGLASCRANINDYTCVLVKRENVGGTLGEQEYMYAKVLNRKVQNGRIVQPMSVYLNFLKPTTVKGREVIYVEGQNDGNLIAHEGGFKGKFLPTVNIPPTGMLAMRGQRYPMTEVGIENLILKLIERGEMARKYPDVTCEFRRNARVKDRVCTVLQVTQPTQRPELLFYQAQIFIDDQLNVPIRYVAYDWPRRAGQQPQVIEEYTYLNVKVNVGLTKADFDPRNQSYGFYS